MTQTPQKMLDDAHAALLETVDHLKSARYGAAATSAENLLKSHNVTIPPHESEKTAAEIAAETEAADQAKKEAAERIAADEKEVKEKQAALESADAESPPEKRKSSSVRA